MGGKQRKLRGQHAHKTDEELLAAALQYGKIHSMKAFDSGLFTLLVKKGLLDTWKRAKGVPL